MDAKIRSARQRVSRIQCVMNYKAVNRPFTPKGRRIVANLRRVHLTLDRAVLQTTKQHCLDRIWMLATCKKTLARRTRCLPPQRDVENPPTVDPVENFWKTLYEERRSLNKYTPALGTSSLRHSPKEEKGNGRRGRGKRKGKKEEGEDEEERGGEKGTRKRKEKAKHRQSEPKRAWKGEGERKNKERVEEGESPSNKIPKTAAELLYLKNVCNFQRETKL